MDTETENNSKKYTFLIFSEIYHSMSLPKETSLDCKEKIVSDTRYAPGIFKDKKINVDPFEKELFIIDSFSRRKYNTNRERTSYNPRKEKDPLNQCKWWYMNQDGQESGPHDKEAMFTLYAQLVFDSNVLCKNYSKMHYTPLSEMINHNWNTFFDENPSEEELEKHDATFRKFHGLAPDLSKAGNKPETAQKRSLSAESNSSSLSASTTENSQKTKKDAVPDGRNSFWDSVDHKLDSQTELFKQRIKERLKEAERAKSNQHKPLVYGNFGQHSEPRPVPAQSYASPHFFGAQPESMTAAVAAAKMMNFPPQTAPQTAPMPFQPIGWDFQPPFLAANISPGQPQSFAQRSPSAAQFAAETADSRPAKARAKMPKTMAKWCKNILKENGLSDDLSMLELCMAIDDMGEIKTHFCAFYGDTDKTKDFAEQFVKQKQFHRNFKNKKSPAPKKPEKAPKESPTPRGYPAGKPKK